MIGENLLLCRLCGILGNSAGNIFEEKPERPVLAALINRFLEIKYEPFEPWLPSHICTECFATVHRIIEFRKMLEERMKCFERMLESKGIYKDNCRPGLNGHVGTFIQKSADGPIIEIEPCVDIVSSEDDFSMDSMDSNESEEMACISDNMNQSMSNKTPIPNGNLMDTSVGSVEHGSNATFLCQFCDVAFTTHASCTDHENSHDASTPYNCTYCDFCAATRNALISHIKTEHKVERPFTCGVCKKGFCRRSDLKKHSIVHTGVRPFRCPYCSKGFSRNTNLTKHIRTHNIEKTHECSKCSCSFTSYQELLAHNRTHTESKVFRCGRCLTTFARKDKLLLHQEEHCDTQNSAAINYNSDNETANQEAPGHEESFGNSILAAQLQQRSNVPKTTKQSSARTFPCDICDKVCYRECDLQRHQALHIDNLHTCKECGISFNRREKLVRHEQLQHQQSPKHTCETCHQSFPNEEAWSLHMQMHKLQQNVTANTQSALNAAAGTEGAPIVMAKTSPQLARRPNPADMSFYSQMVPTMNLGFYSETRPE